jgi:protein gp37
MRLSKIPWTDFSGGDANFIHGCTPVSEGCLNCYAKRFCARFGMNFSKVIVSPPKLGRLHVAKFNPGRKLWRRDVVRKRGRDIEITRSRPMCFVVDTADIFHEDVPDKFILQAFQVMWERSDVDWQVLTKRPRRLKHVLDNRIMSDRYDSCSHIWVGISAESQITWDARMSDLKACWRGMKFASLEPMLERIDIGTQVESSRDLMWCICGGESGPQHRPFDPLWAETIHDCCWDLDIPFFAKQVSAIRPNAPLLIRGKEIRKFPGGPS